MSEKLICDILLRIDDRTSEMEGRLGGIEGRLGGIEERLKHTVLKEECEKAKGEGASSVMSIVAGKKKILIPIGAIIAALATAAVAVIQAL